MSFLLGTKRKNVYSLCGQKDLKVSIIQAILSPLSFVGPSPSTIYDLGWPGAQAPVWGQCELGVVTTACHACPAPLRPDNQGPLVIVTGVC